jgi:hypothetical protein
MLRTDRGADEELRRKHLGARQAEEDTYVDSAPSLETLAVCRGQWLLTLTYADVWLTYADVC